MCCGFTHDYLHIHICTCTYSVVHEQVHVYAKLSVRLCVIDFTNCRCTEHTCMLTGCGGHAMVRDLEQKRLYWTQ